MINPFYGHMKMHIKHLQKEIEIHISIVEPPIIRVMSAQ